MMFIKFQGVFFYLLYVIYVCLQQYISYLVGDFFVYEDEQVQCFILQGG